METPGGEGGEEPLAPRAEGDAPLTGSVASSEPEAQNSELLSADSQQASSDPAHNDEEVPSCYPAASDPEPSTGEPVPLEMEPSGGEPVQQEEELQVPCGNAQPGGCSILIHVCVALVLHDS